MMTGFVFARPRVRRLAVGFSVITKQSGALSFAVFAPGPSLLIDCLFYTYFLLTRHLVIRNVLPLCKSPHKTKGKS
jgi:hypothetical protein